jgi:hypothetical protein
MSRLWALILCMAMALLMAAAPQPSEWAVVATETEQLSAPPMPTRTTQTPTITPAAAYPGPDATIVAYPAPVTDDPTSVDVVSLEAAPERHIWLIGAVGLLVCVAIASVLRRSLRRSQRRGRKCV